ncbi:TIGR03943 family putative permease subunit [Robertmurraya sp.]|uniref:TIGR03943 family putative permease subunit n=1 Tax=Robertmurraya sp. TaxID=2837525 RepID=UPI0037037188
MKFQFQQLLRAFILLGFAGFIFKLHYTGDIGKYINTKYVGFSQVASVLLVFLFFIQLQRIWVPKEKLHHHNHECDHGHGCEHDHGFSSGWSMKPLFSYLILVIPLLTGFVLPAKTLDADMASKKGLLLSSPATGEKSSRETSTPIPQEQISIMANDSTGNSQGSSEQNDTSIVYFDDLYDEKIKELMSQPIIKMTDKNFVSYSDTITLYPEKFKGKQIEMTGFVYKEEGMQSKELVVSRFIITHCVADAGVIGFLADMDDAKQLNKDTWIQIQGILDVGSYGDMEMPVIKVTSWKKVNAPADPYVYP